MPVHWDDIIGRPATFPPTAHTPVAADITDLDAQVWGPDQIAAGAITPGKLGLAEVDDWNDATDLGFYTSKAHTPNAPTDSANRYVGYTIPTGNALAARQVLFEGLVSTAARSWVRYRSADGVWGEWTVGVPWDGTVPSLEIPDGSITTQKLADGAVTADKQGLVMVDDWNDARAPGIYSCLAHTPNAPTDSTFRYSGIVLPTGLSKAAHQIVWLDTANASGEVMHHRYSNSAGTWGEWVEAHPWDGSTGGGGGSEVPSAAGYSRIPSTPQGETSVVTVTFPAGLFSSAPSVVLGLDTQRPHERFVGVRNVTATSFDAYFDNVGAATAINVHWIARERDA